ncbi:MAG TPA: FGGY family carbohydrate kinase [Micromonosporaceae bacterium]|nr:FGGY family carbohydrate kinase [Micromonosporaceae bacterium]
MRAAADGPVLAGVDVGTTNTKVGAYRADGSRLAMRAWPTPRDASDLVAGVLAALAAVAGQAGRAPAAVGVASMAESGVTVDRDLAPQHPLIGWRDPRGADAARRLSAELGEQAVFEVTGVSLAVKTPLARWRWLADTRPGLLTGGRYWLGAADLVASALVGAPVTDLTMAGRTGGLDLRTGRYHPDLLAAAGISAAQLPRVAEPGRPAGRLTASAASSCGLPAGLPVVVAGHDHLVAAYAAGARCGGDQVDSLGTAEAFITVTDRPPAAATAGTGLSWNRFVDGSRYCLVSGFPGAGRLVGWFMERYLGLPAGAGYARFAALAEAVTERPTGIVVEPYLSGRGAPSPDPARRFAVHGRRPRHTAADLALALLEGLSMHVRWMAGGHGPRTRKQVLAAGGPTRNRAWMQVKAAVGPVPLAVVDDPDAACAGAALLAARSGLGMAPPPLAATPLRPDPQESSRYDDLYRDRFLPTVTGAHCPPAHRPEVS